MTEIIIPILLLIVGFALLVYGADLFVDGCSSVARILKVPSLIIGLTIVALGTSLPEAAVSVAASINGNSGISAGNCVGSNFFNLLVVCGLCAVFCSLPVDKALKKRDFPYCLMAGILVPVLAIGELVGGTDNKLGRIDGIILTSLYILYIIILVVAALKNRTSEKEGEDVKVLPVWKSILFIICGATGIIVGGNLTVTNASEVASFLGMSDTLIGLTIVALGTSLPELVTSVVAARKKEIELALGNCIGSNIANFLFVLGLSATVRPLEISRIVLTDMMLLTGVNVLIFLIIMKRDSLRRLEGALMLTLYAGYLAYIFYRNFA